MHQFFSTQLSLWSNYHIRYMTTGKTKALTRRTFASKGMSLLFNMLSRLGKNVLPRSKHLFISWLQSPFAVILEPKKIKSLTVTIVSPFICHEVMRLDIIIFIFWKLGLSQLFTLFFHFHQEALRSSSLSVIRVVSSVYLRLLIFLLAILIPACASSSLAFHMMYSAYKLNNQSNNI